MATYTGIKEILKEFRDRIYPVGVIYIQFPQQKSPEELFPGMTWEELDYDGAFFRASGGNADGFIEESGDLSKQEQSVESHSHEFSVSGDTGNMSANATGKVVSSWEGLFNGRSISYSGNMSATGSIAWAGGDNSGGSHPSTLSINVEHTHSFEFSGETEANSGTETRPENYTMRIWKRTA